MSNAPLPEAPLNAPSVAAVVLAAGKGTRMHSDKPKVLQVLLGETMLHYVAAALAAVDPARRFFVVGHGRELVAQTHPELSAGFVHQEQQLGTGHALQVAWPKVLATGAAYCLVVNGDTPLVTAKALETLVAACQAGADLAFASATLPQAGSFGRVVRVPAGDPHGTVAAIVEAKDFTPAQHGVDTGEVNTGLYCLRVATLGELLFALDDVNSAQEFYITDLVGLAVARDLRVEALPFGQAEELLGVNSPAELAQAEERLRADIVARHLAAGCLLHQCDSIVIGPRAVVEPGAELTGPCRVLGASHVARGASVGAYSQLTDSSVAAGALVREFCHLEGAEVGADAIVGPYARLRPGAVLAEESHVGNFVEMKKATLGRGAKANHLSYLGDAEVGPGANIGAGTITCNYDGVHKHKTVIGAQAFIGSNTALVAPVRVGENALVGAGSTITKDVPDEALAVARGRQVNLPGRGRKS